MSMSSSTKNRKKRSLARSYGSRCAICGLQSPLAALTLDHIIPRGEGGRNALSNLRLACYRCNHGRHNRI